MAPDQPAAIDRLTDGLARGLRHQTLLGATGTGKTAAFALPMIQRLLEEKNGSVSGKVLQVLRYGVVLGKNVLKELVTSPAAALDWTARRYFKPELAVEGVVRGTGKSR